MPCYVFCYVRLLVRGPRIHIPTGAVGNVTMAGGSGPGGPGGRKRYYFDNDTVAKQLKLFWNMAVPYFKVGFCVLGCLVLGVLGGWG